jgi:thioredoxin-related protein
MTTKIILAFLVSSLTTCGQTNKFECKKILDRSPYFLRHKVTEPSDSLQMDFDVLRSCGNLDSIDSELLTGPMLGTILIQHATKDKEVTYKTILKSINAFKKTDNYAKFRDAIIASKTLENKIVTADGFENDKELLIKAGMSQSELDDFKVFIQSMTSQKMTYKEAFTKYSSSKQNSQPSPPDKIEFRKLSDIESAIKTGKENGKKVLLYFSCYACVNARKVEDRILTDNNVKSLLVEKFNYFIAYVDDRSEDKATNSTVGKKFIKLQADNFKTDYQPYFCIIDNDGKVLSEIGYTNKPEEFIEFLNKGLK